MSNLSEGLIQQGYILGYILDYVRSYIQVDEETTEKIVQSLVKCDIFQDEIFRAIDVDDKTKQAILKNLQEENII